MTSKNEPPTPGAYDAASIVELAARVAGEVSSRVLGELLNKAKPDPNVIGTETLRKAIAERAPNALRRARVEWTASGSTATLYVERKSDGVWYATRIKDYQQSEVTVHATQAQTFGGVDPDELRMIYAILRNEPLEMSAYEFSKEERARNIIRGLEKQYRQALYIIQRTDWGAVISPVPWSAARIHVRVLEHVECDARTCEPTGAVAE
jgi:hypothetical protein